MTDDRQSDQSNTVSSVGNQHCGPLKPNASDDHSAISSLSLLTVKLAAFNNTEAGSHFRMPIILQQCSTVLNEAVCSEDTVAAQTKVTDSNGKTFEGLIL